MFSFKHVAAFQHQKKTSHPDSLIHYYTLSKKYQKQRLYLKANQYLEKIVSIEEQQRHWDKYYAAQQQLLINFLLVGELDIFRANANHILSTKTNLKPSFKSFLFKFLAYVYNTQGNTQKAIIFQKKAIALLDKSKNAKELAKLYMSIGNSLHLIGAFDKALSYLQQALHSLTTLKDSAQIANAHTNLSLVFLSKKQYQKALNAAQIALNIRTNISVKNYHKIDASHQNVGLIYNHYGKYPKALEYFHKSLKYCQKKYGKRHPSIASTCVNIASGYQKQEKYDLSLNNYHKAIVI